MLYEVITMLSGAASRAICANHAAPACNNAAPVATTHHKATGVITSYSIHYTKLYEYF